MIGNSSVIDLLKRAVKMDQKQSDSQQFFKVRLIDFGIIERYLEEDGSHIKEGIPDYFRGSIIYASKHSFDFTKNSRRDDLISLVYNLIFLMDYTRLTYLYQLPGKGMKQQFEIAKKAKARLGPKELCGESLKSTSVFKIKPFVEEIWKLKFDELPDYDHLRFLLQKSLLDEDLVPSKHFEWVPQSL